jgi:hypothetical protein
MLMVCNVGYGTGICLRAFFKNQILSSRKCSLFQCFRGLPNLPFYIQYRDIFRCVVDRHGFDADPDPDPTFYFDKIQVRILIRIRILPGETHITQVGKSDIFKKNFDFCSQQCQCTVQCFIFLLCVIGVIIFRYHGQHIAILEKKV